MFVKHFSSLMSCTSSLTQPFSSCFIQILSTLQPYYSKTIHLSTSLTSSYLPRGVNLFCTASNSSSIFIVTLCFCLLVVWVRSCTLADSILFLLSFFSAIIWESLIENSVSFSFEFAFSHHPHQVSFLSEVGSS